MWRAAFADGCAILLRVPAKQRFVEVNGVTLAFWERDGTAPPIVFAHATGFHARCWDQVIAGVPMRHSIAVDMRGHGHSSKPGPPYHWRDFGEDTAALARTLALRGATGVGHSMGGHALVLAAALAPETFAELILIDPVILPRRAYGGARAQPHFARKRRNHWKSPEEMFERFKDRPPFRDWDPAVLRDYCCHGLVRAPHGGYVLACPPEIEGSIYEASSLNDANLYDTIGRIEARVTVIRSARALRSEVALDMSASPTAPDLAAHFRHARDVETPHSHFIPMEAPQLVADYVNGTVNAGV